MLTAQLRNSRRPLGARYALKPATSAETTSVVVRNGRKMRHGDMPDAFITTISESVLSRLSVWPTATTSAIGAMMASSMGISRPVIPTKTSTVWRWLVIRSISRKRVRQPDDHRQTDGNQQERPKSGAENIAVKPTHQPAATPSSPRRNVPRRTAARR